LRLLYEQALFLVHAPRRTEIAFADILFFGGVRKARKPDRTNPRSSVIREWQLLFFRDCYLKLPQARNSV
jgi:hypothetical protein